MIRETWSCGVCCKRGPHFHVKLSVWTSQDTEATAVSHVPYYMLQVPRKQISSGTFQMPVNWSADHWPCWFLVFFFGCLCVCFVLFLVFVVCFLFCTVTAQQFKFPTRSCCWSKNQLQLDMNASPYLPQWRGQNSTLQGEPLLISRGSTFWHLFKHVSSARTFFSCAVHVETHQTNTEFAKKKGPRTREAPNRLQKLYQFHVQKRTPKTSSLHLLVLVMTIFLLFSCERGPVFLKPAIEALRGSVWPRPCLRRTTYWHKDKARLTGTRNCIILLLFQQGWTCSCNCKLTSTLTHPTPPIPRRDVACACDASSRQISKFAWLQWQLDRRPNRAEWDALRSSPGWDGNCWGLQLRRALLTQSTSRTGTILEACLEACSKGFVLIFPWSRDTFFSSGMADHALRLGPYMRRSSLK